MNKSNIEIIETAVKNIKDLEKLGVPKTHPLYREQIEKLVGGTAEYDESLFEEDLENVAKVIPPMNQMVEDDEITRYQESQLNKLQKMISQEETEEKEDYEEEEEKVIETNEVDEYVNAIVNELDIDDDKYRQAFEAELGKVVERVMKGKGYSEFVVKINGEYVNGTVNRYRNGFTVVVGDNKYTATPYQDQLHIKNMNEVTEEESIKSDIEDGYSIEHYKDKVVLIKPTNIKELEDYVNDRILKSENIEQEKEAIEVMRRILAHENPNDETIYEIKPRALVFIWFLRDLLKS